VYDVVLDFPKFKVGVTTRYARVVEIKYLPLSAQTFAAKTPLGERAAKQLER
jgi:hypothetical protein